MGSVTVPLKGDQEYKRAFAIVALQKKVTMASLVRAALDQLYGSEIAEAALFFTQSGQNIIHSDSELVNSAEMEKAS